MTLANTTFEAETATLRMPTMASSLKSLIRHGVEVNAILDIGILNATPPLIEVFPDVKHYLFEPVEFHFDTIRRNYSKLDYELVNIALSDTDGDAYLIGISADGDDKITHSQVRDKPMTTQQDPRVVDCQKIRRAKLDTVLGALDVASPWLLKIDVDGHEIPILRGAEKCLQNTSIVVIEAPLNKCPLPNLIERYQHLVERGFLLVDIVDMAYYDGVLWQVDLIFVRQEIVKDTQRLRPFEAEGFAFDRRLWQPLSPLLSK